MGGWRCREGTARLRKSLQECMMVHERHSECWRACTVVKGRSAMLREGVPGCTMRQGLERVCKGHIVKVGDMCEDTRWCTRGRAGVGRCTNG